MTENQVVFFTANKTLSSSFGRIPATDEFIERNGFTHTRTAEEISKYLIFSYRSDVFGFAKDVLVSLLPLDKACAYLKLEFLVEVEEGKQKWTPEVIDIRELVQDFLDYLVFAWEKAIDERAMSAQRSVIKLAAWMWLLGREDISAVLLNDDLYNPYGSPALIRASEMLGLDVPNELRSFAERKV